MITAPPLLLSLLLTVPLLAHAASDRPVEATRYVNAQGVEIYVPRVAKPAEMTTAGTDSSSPSSGKPLVVVGGSAASHAMVMDTAATPSRKASTAASATTVSEEGRIDILMQELMTEQQALDVTRKALRSPRADVDLSPADRQKLLDESRRREENVRALGRELEQTRAAHTTPTKTALRSTAP